MRVISGRFRGRKLKVLEGFNTRPTLTRVKEDIFNVLNNYFVFENKVGLDLFAGSGALGIEAISRGIKHIYFNELNKNAIKILKENLVGIEKDFYTILNLDYKNALNLLLTSSAKIDIIFLDPPFKEIEYYHSFFEFIRSCNILNKYGILIIESKDELKIGYLDNFVILKYKYYKNKHLYIVRLEE
ncbi:16S rRNA (guanine(966)-N(2))-methyltransferase RsmD [Spiroplasma turonicum]|uniref:N6-adenine-specific methylase n=1 Tax=Spiroplasma turonicum TaxID=216946 RepID=A0A0K1P6A3_9MOLU|nr:16S rRNA (guanine(966)-N(2))-methyltransferase RsmD [Spiroplasma turonicum]AKU79422.1 N6-adenine-specific methylase [Spiroplasma turonicum]ALX70443.1 16S rRNA (guanine966-N2)-methyltransferase [Spiroplasma turonicum]